MPPAQQKRCTKLSAACRRYVLNGRGLHYIVKTWLLIKWIYIFIKIKSSAIQHGFDHDLGFQGFIVSHNDFFPANQIRRIVANLHSRKLKKKKLLFLNQTN